MDFKRKWELQAKLVQLRKERDEAYKAGNHKEWSTLTWEIRLREAELAKFE